jgi:hypothetical protein
MEQELSEINENYIEYMTSQNYYNESFFVYDYMSGQYAFFGAIIDKFNANEDPCVSYLDDIIISHAANDEYNKFLKNNPKYAEVFQKYIDNREQRMMIILHVS